MSVYTAFLRVYAGSFQYIFRALLSVYGDYVNLLQVARRYESVTNEVKSVISLAGVCN